MQSADFYKKIENPQLLDKESVTELQKIVADFPYFQSAHILLSLASKKWDASVYQQSLKKTAIVVSNRSHLFNLIHASENNAGAEPAATVVEIPQKENSQPLKAAEPVIAEPAAAQKDIVSAKEETAQELDILKAAEISVEAVADFMPPAADPGVTLEKEIGKQVVNSFVEKEILKTPQAHKPLLPKEEPESFADWLSYLKKNNGQPYSQVVPQFNKTRKKEKEIPGQASQEPEIKKEEAKPDPRKLKNKAIIDRIIEKNPGLIRTKEEQKFYAPDVKAKESLLENEHLVTETLARIYALQGSVNKAVRAYEILSLKYPQKSAYFASLIQKLKDNQ